MRARLLLWCLVVSGHMPTPGSSSSSSSGSSSGSAHPRVERELHDPHHRLCVDVTLNGRAQTIEFGLTGNKTAAVLALLRADSAFQSGDDKPAPTAAIETMTAWLDNRLNLKVMVRLEVRQRLRRSVEPPRLLLTTAGCERDGCVDVGPARAAAVDPGSGSGSGSGKKGR